MDKYPPNDEGNRLWLPVIFVLMLVMCVAGTLSIWKWTDQGDAGQVADVSIRDCVIDTSIPEQTATPLPTVVNRRDVVYITQVVEVTRVVVQTVERIITATPRAATRTDRPTPTLTPTRDLIPEYAALELSAAKRSNMLSWIFSALGMLFGLMIGMVLVVAGWRAVMPERPTIEETTETAEQIPVNNWKENRIRQRILKHYGEGASLSEIQRKVFGYNGGAAYEKVKEVIDSITPPPPKD